MLVLFALYYLHYSTDVHFKVELSTVSIAQFVKRTALCVVTGGQCRKDVAGDLLQSNVQLIYYRLYQGLLVQGDYTYVFLR